ncbi:acyltransferase domain-containing protein, partial [Streptomyces tsukubensis]|uniref:acyltransferase domain-containing protein n=1 Tax=Streptomyces tsukubensis TaxID=83656 RepID=UPI00344D09EC
PTTQPRRAAISSFGISGTNAHLIIEEPPTQPPTHSTEDRGVRKPPPVLPLVLSARSPRALAAQAAQVLELCAGADAPRLHDIAYSLATTRTALDHRRTVTGADPEEIRAALASVAEGRTGSRPARPGRGCAVLFSGQGAQRPGAGAALHAAHPVFAASFDEISALFEPHLGQPLHEVAFAGPGDPGAELLDRTDHTQPVLFALETAMWRLLESWGFVADFVAGHSLGELTAAHVAGVLDLRSAVTLVAARGRLMNALPAGGAMVALYATEEEVLPLLAAHPDRLAVAAVNAPNRVVLSGAEDAVRKAAAVFPRHRMLRSGHAFHSPLIDGALEEFGRVAGGLSYAPPRLPVVSTLTGRVAEREELCEPSYWVRHARETVRFADAVRTLADRGVDTFAELGPDTVLSGAVAEVFADRHTGGRPRARSALRRGEPEVARFVTLAGWLHDRGAGVDWEAFFAGSGAERTGLPLYPFQRSRYWLSATATPPAVRPPGPDPAPEASTAITGITEFTDRGSDGTRYEETPPDVREFRARMASASGSERRAGLLETVRTLLAGRLGLGAPSEVDPDRQFLDMGLDSLGAVALRERLGALTGLSLPVTLAYDSPTPGEVADFVLGRLDGLAGTGAPPADRTALPAARSGGGVAAELHRLEATPPTVVADAGLRRDIARRLRRLADDWSEPAVPVDPATAGRQELLAFIDRELGRADD